MPHLDCVVNGKAFFLNKGLYTLVIMTHKYQNAPEGTAEFYKSTINKFLDSFRFANGKPAPVSENEHS